MKKGFPRAKAIGGPRTKPRASRPPIESTSSTLYLKNDIRITKTIIKKDEGIEDQNIEHETV